MVTGNSKWWPLPVWERAGQFVQCRGKWFHTFCELVYHGLSDLYSLTAYIAGTRRRVMRMSSGRREFSINFLVESLSKTSHFLTSKRQLSKLNNLWLTHLNGPLEGTWFYSFLIESSCSVSPITRSLKRQPNGYFKDEDLANILHNACVCLTWSSKKQWRWWICSGPNILPLPSGLVEPLVCIYLLCLIVWVLS